MLWPLVLARIEWPSRFFAIHEIDDRLKTFEALSGDARSQRVATSLAGAKAIS